MIDFVQKTLKVLRPDTPNWYGWAKYNADGNKIPNDQRMCWEHAIVIQDGVTKPTKEEFDAKYNELIAEQPAKEARAKRDRLLTESDWVTIRATDTGNPVPTEWQTYRQALRDITEQTGFPENIDWPQIPGTESETAA